MRRSLALALPWLLGALVACEGRPRSHPAQAAADEEPSAGPSVALLDLSGGVPEQPPSGLLGLPSGRPSFDRLVHEIDRLGEDRHVRGVLVRLGTASIGLARATEIGTMLHALGAKVPVWCHADELGNGTVYLAARACKRVWLSPPGTVDAIGIAAQTVYFHQLLADELGLDVDFLQVGKYKGAEEPFTRDGPSPEALESLQSTLADMRASWLDGIRAARPAVAEATPEDGPYTAAAAKERGLVDDVGYFDEARKALETSSGAVRTHVRLGADAHADGDGELADVLRTLAGESIGTAPVALVRATGAITMEAGGGLLGGSGGIVEERLIRTLTRLEKDDDVKAVVLRIDSPGGSALASDLLWHELMRIRARKVLVVSVGGMAASGGYYLASSGQVVFADPTSIVGSIGVVGGKVSADRALARIGIHVDTIPAKAGDPRAAARAGYESLLEPWDDATRSRLLDTMTGVYQLFLSRVAQGRGIPVEKVAASAEGRIFSGRDGKGRGLVDELGGLEDALARARSLAGLPADARVAVAGEVSPLLRALDDGDVASNARATSLPSAQEALAATVLDVLPELQPFVASLQPVAAGERTLCALPFALTVR